MAGRAKSPQGQVAPTSADVARVTGVSRATISLVLNGGASKVRISEETRARVLAAAAEIGYRPNHAARSLRQRRTRSIAIVLPSIANPYFSEVVLGAQAEARAAGYTVAVIVSDRTPEGLAPLEGSTFDGIIVAGRENVASPVIRQLSSHGVAVVVLQQHSPDPAIRSVRVDLSRRRLSGDPPPAATRPSPRRPHHRAAAGQPRRTRPLRRLSPRAGRGRHRLRPRPGHHRPQHHGRRRGGGRRAPGAAPATGRRRSSPITT